MADSEEIIRVLPVELAGGFDQCKAFSERVLDFTMVVYREYVAAGASPDSATARAIAHLCDLDERASIGEGTGLSKESLLIMLGIAVARMADHG